MKLIEIGTPLIKKGFRLTPVHPLTKMGVFRNWGNHQATTVEKLQEYATTADGKYADHGIGVVGKRGIGRHMFVDIDAKGVVERIEQETGQKMPATYTVQSRPSTMPWKRHFYFLQTLYSFKQFAKFAERGDPWKSVNLNVKDMTETDGEGKHPTLYDVKGIGGGSLVVGAGSVRESGEVYTAIDADAEVVPVPNWLVDWLVADVTKFKIANRAEINVKRDTKILCREKFNLKERKACREQNMSEGFDVYPSDIYWFLRWRAGSFASLGQAPADIERDLYAQVKRFCLNGKAFCDT
ncbi:MAG TPA: bifunctional DNA primase/polymerase, partial [Nitrososphaera sp.]|nr:bifunctional DNA primase/polymerase [Nitrososphaera sp.]